MATARRSIQELRDERGHIIDERRKPEMLWGSHSLYVPLTIQIEHRRPEWPPVPWASTVPCLVYQVPDTWQDDVSNVDLFKPIADGMWGWERRERFSAETLLARGRRGLHGSRGGADPSGLLNDFLKLAHEYLPEGELPEGVIDRVVMFVKKWGPLWLCRTPDHFGHNRICFWEPRQAIYWGGTTKLCSWRPVEEVYAFVREAQSAKSVIQAIGEHRRICDVYENSRRRLQDQMDALLTPIRNRLALHGSHQMYVKWLNPLSQPKLHLVSKVGFIHVVWNEIAQLLCESKGPLQCDGCGEWYFREGRRPKAGQKHFCQECREYGRGSKRLYARRKRSSHDM